jgi:hypothetical protein
MAERLSKRESGDNDVSESIELSADIRVDISRVNRESQALNFNGW